MNGFQKIIYKFLQMKEKSLQKRLAKHLKTSTKNSTSKMVLSNSATLTLTSETEKNIEIVKKNVADIVKSCGNNPEKLLAYIESKGTKVCFLNNADKLLSGIKEEEGLITSLEGLEFVIELRYTASSPSKDVISPSSSSLRDKRGRRANHIFRGA